MQSAQWHKEKVQTAKQRSTKHSYKSKDRVTRTPLKTGVNTGAPEGYAVPSPLETDCIPILNGIYVFSC